MGCGEACIAELSDGTLHYNTRRQVFEGNFAYSALNTGRPGTPSEGWTFTHFEGGPHGGSTFARFNLSWIVEGEKTGDGETPDWVGK
jgi:sialidase-1